MGRPFTIREAEFSAALRQFLQPHTEQPLETDLQLLDAFKSYPKSTRQKLWQHLAKTLNKTNIQVKNYFFNTWAERINKTEEINESVQSDSGSKSNVYYASNNGTLSPENGQFSNEQFSIWYESVPELIFGLFD
ncbi:Conserved_hypothetical protein [Hexamita inflata]|uniref:Uncharacterized protein n=1 Tax=Hexamita inflata TaxID=28002 RepID=A0AA86QJP2_9EUKA|nr:Conserved hypothetical protein [Hexamita inflata]